MEKECTGESSGQKNHSGPAVTRLLCPVIKKLDIKKYCIQKTVPLEKNTPCTASQDKLKIKYDNQNVYISLASQKNVDVHDSDSKEILIKVSSAQEREARRLARLKQLEKMRAFEVAFSRQNRYQKRINNMKSVKLSIRKVKWKKEDLFVYHFYHNESQPSSNTDS